MGYKLGQSIALRGCRADCLLTCHPEATEYVLYTKSVRALQERFTMSRWFRHYAGMMRDDKLVRASIASKQSIERVVWVWGAILESAAEIDEGGIYDVDPAEIAYFLRAEEADIRSVINALECMGRISAGSVVKWGNRQFQSDRSASRVAAYRERKRSESDRGNAQSVTRNADVTLPKRHGNAPETETETETEIEEPKGSCASEDAPVLKPEHIVEVWNQSAESLGKPKVRNLTPERRQLLKARIGQYQLEDFQSVLGKVGRSAFLRGDTGWRGCTFDWVFKKANFQKILEGNYDQ